MSVIRVGLASVPVEANARSRNLETVGRILDEYAKDDIDLFVFGEAVLTGLDGGNAQPDGVANTSEVLRMVDRLTKGSSTAVCVGFIERQDHRRYLTHYLSYEGTLCGVQRKVFAGNPTRPHIFSSGKEILSIPYEPDLILAPTDQYSWTPHNRSVLHKAAQSSSFWLQAPLVAAFSSTAGPSDEHTEVFACLAYDSSGEESIKASKKVGESTVHMIDVELQKAHRKWGGFRERKRYIDSV